MDRWERIQKPPSRRGCDYPSFSSSLLDSIYQSIDDETRINKTDRGAPDPPRYSKSKPMPEYRWIPPQPVEKNDRGREPRKTYYSSSSDSSSYGFSSEPESVNLNRLKPIKTVHTRSDMKPPLVPVQQSVEKKKKNLKSRFKDLKKTRSPTSPAAKLAGFLNSLFTKKNTRNNGGGGGAAISGEESTCSSASSFTRSCLAKTPADHKRSVRFELPATDVKMTWREFEREEEDDDDVASDASSDLFELPVIGKYRDELPVYETTHIGKLVL